LACYPNPFNDRSIVHFVLPESGSLHLAVYNALGQKVRTLADGHHHAGPQRIAWGGRDECGDEVSAGLYFCRMKWGGLARTMKMVLLK
jgi:flagellar hook assembly protein FlgD